ncbi:MAG: hypothetical protein EON58_06470 [Alphaproteobacteria bacterium]|nr:MAG: hypothetical protein EON58_06470 [Alphaproteobacteria bacterium]
MLRFIASHSLSMLAGCGSIAASTPALASQTWYYDPTVVAAGSAKQIAHAAKIAIDCGIDFVNVRPWKEGDTVSTNPHVTRRMSLIIQVSRGSDIDKVMGCFEKKWAGL